MKKTVFTVCLLFMVLLSSWGYEQRNLLQNAASEALIRNSLVMKQAWVPFPKYADRADWDQLFGKEKEAIIEAGSKLSERPIIWNMNARAAETPCKTPIIKTSKSLVICL